VSGIGVGRFLQLQFGIARLGYGGIYSERRGSAPEAHHVTGEGAA
jgi:hypothetical protein